MVQKTSTRWAVLGAAILLAPLSQPLLADGLAQALPKAAPAFVARQAAVANGQAEPVGNTAANPQQAAVIIYLPAGSQPFDLQALLAGASTPSAAAGRQPGPKPEQLAPARPSGPAMLLPQPREAAPARAPGLPAASHALFPAHPQSPPLESQIANFVTNPPPRAVPVAAPVAQPQADSTVQSGEPRQRALIPASSLPLKINESQADRGIFEWPEGMKAKPVEDTPAPQSPIAKRTRAIFRAPEIPRSAGEQEQATAQPATAQPSEPSPRSRALFSQRPEAPIAAPPAADPPPAPNAPSESATLGPYAPEPPRIQGAPHEPVTQSPVSVAPSVPAMPPSHSAPVTYAQPQPQVVPPQHAQARALFSKPVDDRPGVLSVAEQILGPNVLPPSPAAQGQSAQPIANQPTVPSTRPRSKALLPKSMFVRAKPGARAEPDPLKKYLPTNYPPGGTSRVAASAQQSAPQPSVAPAVAATSASPTHSRSLFPLKFFGQQAEVAPAPTEPTASHQVASSSQTPTLAAVPPNDAASEIVRPNLQPMSAAAPGTSPAKASESDITTSGSANSEQTARGASDGSDWRPSKRRRKPTTAKKTKEPKTEIATAEKTEATSAAAEEPPTHGSDSPAGQAIVKIERAVKPAPAVIVPLASPPAAPMPAAERDETPLNNARDFETAVKRSSATEPRIVGESPAMATDTPHKRRPVTIIRPEKHDESKTRRSNPVRIVRGGSDSQAGPAADVSDDEEHADADHRKVVVSSAHANRSKSVRPFPHGSNPSAGRSNPLR